MPKGFIITKWTDEGLEIPIQYPNDLHLDYDDLMRIFYAHITGAGQAGNLVVRLESARSNVSSFFTGMESEEEEESYMINLVLDIDEEPDIFGEEKLHDININILEYLKLKTKDGIFNDPSNDVLQYLKYAFYTLERLENLSKEQRMAQIYSSRKGKCILDLLQEKPRSKAELQSLVEKKLNTIISNFDLTLDPFFKTDLIKQDWIEGLPDIYLFLKTDFVIYRKPPELIVESAKRKRPTSFVAKKYLNEVKEFFRTYEPSLEDSLKLTHTMIDPDLFNFLLIFREQPFQLKKIPKSPAGSFVSNEELISFLKKDNFIKIIQDKDKRHTEWVFLLTDIAIKTFFPSYLIENIRKEYSTKTLKKEIAIKSLSILEKSYKKN